MFERFFALRNVYIIAVISLFAGALLMFVVGAERTALAFSAYLTNFNAGELRVIPTRDHLRRSGWSRQSMPSSSRSFT